MAAAETVQLSAVAEKAELRRVALARRAALAPEARAAASVRAAQHFMDEVAPGAEAIVGLFWPIRDEIDSRPLAQRLFEAGHRIALPVVLGAGQALAFRQWRADARLVAAGFGTLAPDADAPVVFPDIIVVPLLGFDRFGTRLGYGGGYYDRTLALLPSQTRIIGYGFAAQELDAISRDAHDVPLDAVVTEAGLTLFKQQDSA